MKVLSNLSLYGTLGLNSVVDANTDTDKFLVIDSNGIVKYRTGQELYNDIGAGGAASYTSTLQHEVKAGVALTKGQAVYVTSADGTNMIVSKASNASEATSSKTLGLIAQDLNINGKGYVITEGLLSGLNTMAAGTEGDPVWLGTDGNLIYGLGSKPYAPDHLVFIGIVTRRNANNGEIFVKVQNGFELQELHNVQITSTPSDNTVLAYETSTSLYKMKSIPALLGYTPANAARTLSINGVSYDLSADRSWSVGTTTGSGSAGQVAYWDGSSSQAGSNNLFWDTSSNRLGIGLTNPQRRLEIYSSTADSHLRISGSAPSVSLGEAITGSVYQAKFGLATGNGQYSTSAAAGDFIIISQTGATIWMTGTTDRLKLFYGGNFVVGGGADSSLARLQVVGGIQQSSVTSSMLKVDSNGVLVAATSGTDFVAPASLASYVPTSRTITINGTTYDLSANRSWSITAGVATATAGNGISIGGTSSNIIITNTGVLTATASNGISIGGTSSNITIANTGVLTATASNGISIGGTSSNITISNTGILTATAGNGISVSVVSGGLTITNTITNNNQLTNGAGYLTGITSSQVTTALGYTPYNSSNPSGYITSAALSGYATQSWVTSQGYLTSVPSHNQSWSTITSTPTTLGGYGITDALYQARATLNVNDFPDTGLYRGSTSGWTNRPTVVHNGGALLHIDTHPGGYYAQLFFDSGGNRIYMRSADAYSWQSWVTIINSGNYNSYSPTLTGGGASGTWGISITGNADTVDGYHASTSTIGNYIVVRDGNGYIFGNYINMTDNVIGSGVTGVIVKQGDNYYRTGTAGAIQSFLGLGSMAYASTSSYATSTHTHGLTRYSLAASGLIDGLTSANFRSTLFDSSTSGYNISAARWNNVPSGISGMNSYGTMIAWSGSDTHGFLALDYITANAQIGGGYGDNISWKATLIHSGNIGSQSVNYASTAGNANSISAAVGGAYTWTATNYFRTNNGGYAVNNSSSPSLQAYSDSNNSAFMSFHKGGYYAVNFGLDADNWMRIGGWSASSNRWQLNLGTGDMYAAGDITAYSDARVKTNILTIEKPLEKTLSLRGVTYTRTDSEDKKTKMGVIAQEVLEIIPEVVNQDNNGTYSVAYGNMVGLLIESIKEQQKQIEDLKKQLNGLTK